MNISESEPKPILSVFGFVLTFGFAQEEDSFLVSSFVQLKIAVLLEFMIISNAAASFIISAKGAKFITLEHRCSLPNLLPSSMASVLHWQSEFVASSVHIDENMLIGAFLGSFSCRTHLCKRSRDNVGSFYLVLWPRFVDPSPLPLSPCALSPQPHPPRGQATPGHRPATHLVR